MDEATPMRHELFFSKLEKLKEAFFRRVERKNGLGTYFPS
jgi:hypothetical protein